MDEDDKLMDMLEKNLKSRGQIPPDMKEMMGGKYDKYEDW